MNPLEFLIQYVRFVRFPIFNFTYDANGNVTYIGIAEKGTPNSANKWMIVKFTYNGSDQVTDARLSEENVSWDNRLSILYS